MKIRIKNYGKAHFIISSSTNPLLSRIVSANLENYYYFNRHRRGFLITLLDSQYKNDFRVTKENSCELFYKQTTCLGGITMLY